MPALLFIKNWINKIKVLKTYSLFNKKPLFYHQLFEIFKSFEIQIFCKLMIILPSINLIK
jgi:hypothetical protein